MNGEYGMACVRQFHYELSWIPSARPLVGYQARNGVEDTGKGKEINH